MSELAKILVPAVQLLYSRSFMPKDKNTDFLPDLNIIMPMQEKDLDDRIKNQANFLVNGVSKNMESLDERIRKYLKGWKISRLGLIELILLRCGIYLLQQHVYESNEIIEQVEETAQEFNLGNACRFLTRLLDAVASE